MGRRNYKDVAIELVSRCGPQQGERRPLRPGGSTEELFVENNRFSDGLCDAIVNISVSVNIMFSYLSYNGTVCPNDDSSTGTEYTLPWDKSPD